MKNLTTASLFLLATGILTSVTVLSGYQVLFAIPLIYFTFQALKTKEFNVPKSAWILLAFMGVALISLIINFEHIPKPSKNFGRLKYFYFGFGGIIVLRFWLKNATMKTKKFITSAFLVSVIVAGLFATYTFFTNGESRARGFTDTLRYGYGSAMFLLTLMSAILHREKIKEWFHPGLGLAAFVTGFVGMYLTYNRGSILAFMCGIPFVFYFYKKKLGLSIGGLAILGVLLLGGFYLFGTGKYNSRFLMNKNNLSDVMRRSQWKAAIIATEEKPVLGWGLSNFSSQLKRIKYQYDLDAKFYDDAHAHNLFLEVAAGTGITGLIIFITWVLTWAWEIFRTGGLVRALVIPFGVAFIVGSQFEVTFDANNAGMIFFLYAFSSCFTVDARQQV